MRSAAHLHELRATSRHGVDVIVPRGRERRHAGIDMHQATRLAAGDLTIVSSIPVTTVARMILDLAAVVEQRAVERVIGEADDRGVFDLWAVEDQLNRNPKHPGTPRVRAALGPDRAGLTDSELEELFVAIWWPTGGSDAQNGMCCASTTTNSTTTPPAQSRSSGSSSRHGYRRTDRDRDRGPDRSCAR